jgi:hypothetical protein
MIKLHQPWRPAERESQAGQRHRQARPLFVPFLKIYTWNLAAIAPVKRAFTATLTLFIMRFTN